MSRDIFSSYEKIKKSIFNSNENFDGIVSLKLREVSVLNKLFSKKSAPYEIYTPISSIFECPLLSSDICHRHKTSKDICNSIFIQEENNYGCKEPKVLHILVSNEQPSSKGIFTMYRPPGSGLGRINIEELLTESSSLSKEHKSQITLILFSS